MKKKKATINSTVLTILIVAFLLCVAIFRLSYIVLSDKVDGVDLKEFAKNRNTKTKTLYASRGTIYDYQGEELALSVNSYTLIAYLSEKRTTDMNKPQHVVDKGLTAKKLSEILDIEEEKMLEYLSKDAYQVEFGSKGKNLTEKTKKEIEKLELPGIDFIEGTKRYYKMGAFASYIIGYAKTGEDGLITGELGIESYFNEELSGKDGSLTYQADAYGYQLPNKNSYIIPSESGADIYLTLDSNIQMKAENAINDLSEEYDFDWAIVTIMDAKTGAIKASATSPNYNPNNLNTLTSYINPLVSYTYEPGSTMKTFSWAAAMEEGIYDGNETYKSGQINVADVTIKDANNVGWGTITFDRGYAMSSNVAATKIALELGVKNLYKYYDKFGFGKKTGIELSGEVKGDIDFKYKSELASAAFGQGITTTPVQLLQAYSIIANDGVMLKPYIVDKIVSQDGEIILDNEKEIVGKVMSKETTDYMKKLMHDANYDGLSRSWQPKSVSMGIKTGTSQIASPQGGYLKGQYDLIYSVAGIFPEDNPEYIIYAAVNKIIGPQLAVAKMTTTLVDDIASYAKITEEENNTYEENIIKLDNFISKKTEDVVNELKASGG